MFVENVLVVVTLVLPGALSFLCWGFFLCHLGSERLSSRSDEPCQFSREAIRPPASDDFNSVGMKPPLSPLVSLRLIAAL